MGGPRFAPISFSVPLVTPHLGKTTYPNICSSLEVSLKTPMPKTVPAV